MRLSKHVSLENPGRANPKRPTGTARPPVRTHVAPAGLPVIPVRPKDPSFCAAAFCPLRSPVSVFVVSVVFVLAVGVTGGRSALADVEVGARTCAQSSKIAYLPSLAWLAGLTVNTYLGAV